MLRRLLGSRARRSYEKGIEQYNAGEMSAAIEHFDATLAPGGERGDPDASLARFYRGEAHARLGAELLDRQAPRDALVHFDAALADHPAYPDLHLQRGLALLCLDDALAAESAARRALERNAEFVEAGAVLCLALAAQGQTHRAQEERRRWQEVAARRGHPARDLLARDDLDLRALLQLRAAQRARRRDIERVDNLLHAGFWEEARTVLDRLIADTPRYPDLLLRMAAATCGSGDFERATVHLEAALAHNPRFADAHVLAGVVALRQDRIDVAAQHFAAAQALGNLASPVLYGLAVCELRTGAWSAARRRLDAIWEQEEFRAEARFLRAALVQLDGDTDTAVRLYEDALASTDRTELLLDAAACGLMSGRTALVRRVVEALPRGAPQPEAAIVRAWLMQVDGARERALDVLGAAAAAHPSDPALLWELARAHAARGEAELALRRLAELRTLGIDVPGASALTARLHRERGALADARATLGLRGEPGFADADTALEHLFVVRLFGEVDESRVHWQRWAAVCPLDLRWRLQDPERWLRPLAPWPSAHPDGG